MLAKKTLNNTYNKINKSGAQQWQIKFILCRKKEMITTLSVEIIELAISQYK